MEYLQISPDDTTRWDNVWTLYEESFPEAERRKRADHLRACIDSRFFPLSAWEGRELIGLLFFIGTDPLPPGHIWALSPGSQDDGSGLYRIEVNETPGSGYRLANVQPPGPLRESATAAYQNLVSYSRQLLGDREVTQRELTVQVRAMDASKTGAQIGVPILLAFCSAILGKSLRGGLVVAGGLTVGGSIEPVHNALDLAELAAEKGAQVLLLPVASRRQLNDMSDDLAARLAIIYYIDGRDALLKALAE